jgi:hypothetical protein
MKNEGELIRRRCSARITKEKKRRGTRRSKVDENEMKNRNWKDKGGGDQDGRKGEEESEGK